MSDVDQAVQMAKKAIEAGVVGFPSKNSELLEKIEAGLKKQANGFAPAAAAAAFGALVEGLKEPVVPFLLPMFDDLLGLCADKKNKELQDLASNTAKTFAKSLSEYGTEALIDVLLHVASTNLVVKVQVLALELLQMLSESAPTQVEDKMVDIVPALSALMWSTKAPVVKQSKKALEMCCRAIDNVDLEPFIPALISTISDPSQVEETVQALASTTFVQAVTASALSITVPILERGFKERKTAVKRMCAVVTENMAKLVSEPAHVAPFMPVLEPALKTASEGVSDPECRSRCKTAHEALTAIGNSAGTETEYSEQKKKNLENGEKNAKAIVAPLAKTVYGTDKTSEKYTNELVHYVGLIYAGLLLHKELQLDDWNTELKPCLLTLGEDNATKATNSLHGKAQDADASEDVLEDQDDDAELLCDTKFSLAYGSKILLNNARLHLKRGRRYGIVAPKSAGKTTLLRAISNNQVEGFPTPDQLKTVFVEDDIQGSQAKMDVVEFVLHTVGEEKTKEEVEKQLAGVGFDEEMLRKPISALSGGWRIKTSLARAMLRNADILLLDDPSNHLDVLNVQWLVDYLTGEACKEVTSLIVSHDTGFLDKVATNIIHYTPTLKLDYYVGNLSVFVEHHPEAKAYYELGNTDLVFRFPQPAPLDGVKNRGKTVMSMTGVEFQYPGTPAPQLLDVNIKVSMASRVACVGANGAGKSTMIKLLTGELKPTSGTVFKNPNLRFAYVAQHAFHHIESHLSKTPNEYIRWRYANGDDKEALKKDTVVVTDEEREQWSKPIEVILTDEDGNKTKEKRVLEKLMGRRKEGKKLFYEIKWKGKSQDANTWMESDELMDRGFKKLVEAIDRKILAQEGSYSRILSSKNVEEHLGNVGLDAELSTHTRISALSGGQKVKVVLAACTWYQPHIIILDEPTNYLDREALGALANALNIFEGGVVLITHNKEFAEKTTRETWVVANHRCDVKGDADWEKYAQEAVELGLGQGDMTDAAGNKVEVQAKRTPDSVKPREKKKMLKELKKKIDAGDELTPFEEQCADAWNVWEM